MTIEPVRCRCGGVPEVFTRMPVATGRFQGEVCCPDCGEQVLGKLHLYNRDFAAEEAVAEWNAVMRKEEEDE